MEVQESSSEVHHPSAWGPAARPPKANRENGGSPASLIGRAREGPGRPTVPLPASPQDTCVTSQCSRVRHPQRGTSQMSSKAAAGLRPKGETITEHRLHDSDTGSPE